MGNFNNIKYSSKNVNINEINYKEIIKNLEDDINILNNENIELINKIKYQKDIISLLIKQIVKIKKIKT